MAPLTTTQELSSAFDNLAELIDSLHVEDSFEVEFRNLRYVVDFETFEDCGFSYKCPRLGPNCYQVFVDQSLSDPERRVVLLHELIELYLYYAIGIRPLQTAHEMASQQHRQYAASRSISPPPQ